MKQVAEEVLKQRYACQCMAFVIGMLCSQFAVELSDNPMCSRPRHRLIILQVGNGTFR